MLQDLAESLWKITLSEVKIDLSKGWVQKNPGKTPDKANLLKVFGNILIYVF